MIVDVPSDILDKVAEITASTTRMGIKVDWMDETLGMIATKKKHLNLLKKSKDLEDELMQLDRRRAEITRSLAEVDANRYIMILAFRE